MIVKSKKIVALLIGYLVLMPVESFAVEPWKFGIHPYLPALDLIERFEPLVSYLEQITGREIDIFIASSYEQLIDEVVEGNVELAYMGPALYASLGPGHDQVVPLAKLAARGKPFFSGAIVTRGGSSIQGVKDLVDKRFAFGSVKSTMSHIVPRYEMEERGVSVDQLGEYQFVGSHRNVALSVLAGRFDAGAVKEEVYEKYRNRGLRALLWTRKIPEHVFVASSALSPSERDMIKRYLLKLKGMTPEEQQILRAIKKTATSLVPARRHDYDELSSILGRVNSE